jgi:hypothetical protein
VVVGTTPPGPPPVLKSVANLFNASIRSGKVMPYDSLIPISVSSLSRASSIG